MKGFSTEEQRRLIGRILAPTPEDPGPDLASLDPAQFDQGQRRAFITVVKDGHPPETVSPDFLEPNELAAIWASNPDGATLIPCLQVTTAHELLTTDWPEPAWAIPGLLPVGLCILAGKPKVGKSWLALQIAQAVSTGGMVFGERVQRGPVLYLALEDSERRLARRMKMQGWTDSSRGDADFMTLPQFMAQVGALNGGGLERLVQQMRARSYRFVVIDTLSRAFRGDQNDADTMTAALSPLQAAALDLNCVVLILDHHRKGRDADILDPILDLGGSISKGGIADAAWGLYREQGKSGATLAITGRDLEEKQLKLSHDPMTRCWQCDGDANKIKQTEARNAILEALQNMGEATPAAIAKYTDRDRSNVYRQLQDLVNNGQVVKLQNGKYRLASEKSFDFDIPSNE